MPNTLSIVIIEKECARAQLIVEALSAEASYHVQVISDFTGLRESIAACNPDVVLIDLTNPSRDILEELTMASSPLERPVAMFVDQSETMLTQQAVDAGVSAYVVNGLQPDRIRPVLDAAIARFHLFHRLRAELDATKRALEERKVIDRAKAILIRSRNMTEDDAYALLRKTAMDKGRRIADVAEALITAASMLR
ncbi:ANTAR domain-containing response regulator [Pseudoruegeria sp. SK021]|uniref:ANTAR domain-containing response regulator n=1 Tax=Pseudoruegeria sp. SK021 TaxID=1933035 RepID=UPI000A247F4A|nr:ANTAR domain-containing protein [Pseudoruegeria sp. SK021]OSP56841.1 two-component system response regulator [Pseudoruegeria sp. SK021]